MARTAARTTQADIARALRAAKFSQPRAPNDKAICTPRKYYAVGLNVRQAAAYWGVSVGTFNKLVRLGLAPQPLQLPGCCRNMFDEEALNRAMDAAKGRVMSSATLQINVIPKRMLDKKEAA